MNKRLIRNVIAAKYEDKGRWQTKPEKIMDIIESGLEAWIEYKQDKTRHIKLLSDLENLSVKVGNYKSIKLKEPRYEG